MHSLEEVAVAIYRAETRRADCHRLVRLNLTAESMARGETLSDLLTAPGLVASMGRRGQSHDNAKVESFMKTIKVEEVYAVAYETFEHVVENLPHFIDKVYNKRR